MFYGIIIFTYQTLTKTAWGLSSTSLRQFRAFSITTLEENFAYTTPTTANSNAVKERMANLVADLIVNSDMMSCSCLCSCVCGSSIFDIQGFSYDLSNLTLCRVVKG